jgi:hypothetical protein
MALLKAVTAPEYSPGQLAALLRSYTTGFVIDEQTFLELTAAGIDQVRQEAPGRTVAVPWRRTTCRASREPSRPVR